MRYLLVAATLATGCLNFGGNGAGGGGSGGGGGGGGSTSSDAHVLHNLQTLNMYRAQSGAPALALDDQLSMFSVTAAQTLEANRQPHAYFIAQGNSGAIWHQGFCSGAAENQAPGWPINGDLDATVDAILKAMMDEGPGGGHHDNIVNPANVRLGVGLVVDAQQQLWFSNDFSGACR